MAKFWVIRVENGLQPDSVESQEVFDKVPFGKPMECEVKQKRNSKHHRLFFKILARIVSYLDRDDITTEVVLLFFKKHLGMYREFETKTVGLIQEYDSISFEKMDQIAFTEFFEKVIRFAYVEWQIPVQVFSDLLERKDER